MMDGIGAKLLKNMGWTENTGLGAKRDGIQVSLQVKQKLDKNGIGVARKSEWQNGASCWWESAYDHSLAKMANGQDQVSAKEQHTSVKISGAGEDMEVAMREIRDARKDNGGKSKGSVGLQDSIFEKCAGRRCRPGGVSKMRRVEEMDRKLLEMIGIAAASPSSPIKKDEHVATGGKQLQAPSFAGFSKDVSKSTDKNRKSKSSLKEKEGRVDKKKRRKDKKGSTSKLDKKIKSKQG